ncbi:hypothetical protein FNF31_05651 [Cafeteria roenbergensis]|uniref:Uncharacterized protein n=1 Tax=Cafeteria roenbergensis TaxID=33653 RepID=A0A5A8CXI8_CAFRO|nr:hypothetical protein FNF31_05651 [Cafeteria roenbergensis]
MGQTNCKECGLAATCGDGVVELARFGYWWDETVANISVIDDLMEAINGSVYECPFAAACQISSSSSDIQVTCLPGYSDALCANCSKDTFLEDGSIVRYVRSGDTCQRCDMTYNLAIVGLFGLGIVAFCLKLALLDLKPKSGEAPVSYNHYSTSEAAVLRILLNFTAVAGAVGSFADVAADQVKDLMSSLDAVSSATGSVAESAGSPVSCAFGLRFESSFALWMGVPAGLGVLILSLFLIRFGTISLLHTLGLRTESQRPLGEEFQSQWGTIAATFVPLYFTVFTYVATTTIAAFVQSTEVDGKKWIRYDYSMLTSVDGIATPSFERTQAIAVGVGIVVYIIGLPAAALCYLRANKGKLTNPDQKAKFGFLYDGYELGLQYQGLDETLLNAGVDLAAGMLEGLRAEDMLSADASFAAAIVLGAFLLITAGSSPFVSPDADFLELFSLVTLTFTQLGVIGLRMFTIQLDTTAVTVIVWSLILLNIAMTLLLVLALVAHYLKSGILVGAAGVLSRACFFCPAWRSLWSRLPAMEATKPFTLDEAQFDQSTYLGRVRHFLKAVNPLTLLYTKADVDKATALIASWKDNGSKCPEGVTDADLWAARDVRDAVVHPDTGEPIPMVFRMSAFVPVNIPVAGGMVLAKATAPQLFWQGVNQSYNSGFNYANRNATVDVKTSELAMSFGLAVTVACGSAFLGGKLAARIAANPAVGSTTKSIVSRVVPWFAVAAAGSFNALAMRYKEAIDGVEVRDHTGEVRGVSKKAGVNVLTQVVATRVVLPIPIILLPPFISDLVRAVGPVGRAIAASAGLGLAADLAVVAACLWVALPLAIAIFPQTASIGASSLEPEFRDLVGSDGVPVATFTCNKGL